LPPSDAANRGSFIKVLRPCPSASFPVT